eukprot:GHVO01043788.1.p1 GENE.GHVO01043788.1~~GHVO01043788.1.p1  ORF type:complete len:497 (+),score=48.11 GHVO01043788.1:81-1571(+)
MGNCVGVDVSGMLRASCIIYCSPPDNTPDITCSHYSPSFILGRSSDHSTPQPPAEDEGWCFCRPPLSVQRKCITSGMGPQDISWPACSTEEDALLQFLKHCPLWGSPSTFCFRHTDGSAGKVYCFIIEVNKAEEAIDLALKHIRHKTCWDVTGSGTFWFREMVATKQRAFDRVRPPAEVPILGPSSIETQEHRELACLLEAIDFIILHTPQMCFSYQQKDLGDMQRLNVIAPRSDDYVECRITNDDIKSFYPFLLVNCKAGVSFHKVTAPGVSVRVGGSPIGGGTFMGLASLLCGKDIAPLEAFIMAQEGDNSAVDMLVSDIYGGDYAQIGLKGSTIASTFGKMQTCKDINLRLGQPPPEGDPPSSSAVEESPPLTEYFQHEKVTPSNTDVARSLLTMMSFNISQLAYFQSVIHNCQRIAFVGYYLEMPGHLASIQHCIDFWSHGECRTSFFRLAPGLAAFGAALRTRRRKTSSVYLEDWMDADVRPLHRDRRRYS